MNRVVHCERVPPGSFTYIGRAAGERGRYGNPFVLGKHGNRDEVIAMYDGWLRTGNNYCVPEATEERRQDILSHLKELKDKTLGCYCFPKLCHGWVLVSLLSELKIETPPSDEA